ncbi:4-hydroxy-3-methylbut-2-enyl diphosphate reductase [Roseiconus nitratireducens]|uniref:4-hydroxy-3-methylbut-2-enyl diphosphate reductase n=1 Tax=Roseiconus nitratireducens TaxID=2605748 RepID=A0A5M6DH18_9BACT|nr:4-hydroxy-3-methylbut-2-enyl diphosphate reductase [Roseiconus nitratireducens]KAA5545499.1 4-hydroxy-3-methylbut-2-enyl diphosphate reductase [Roseiconus nitratireducens]
MKIIRASDLGMCFGVRDALQMTRQIPDPTQVTIHGELVHNPRVIHQLSRAGFQQAAENDRSAMASTPQVLITAHGISDAERKRLRAAGKQLIDTTCPLVRRVHEAAVQLAAEGRHVLLIGKPGHIEVLGIIEDLESYDVIASPQDVRAYESETLGVICQTTMPMQAVDEIRACISRRNPHADIRFIDTVCHPTKRRQQAMSELIRQVDAVVVVGGRNSNNTRRLAELCQQHGVPAVHVTCADEIDPTWFGDAETVGLTAGTSTLDETINEVHERLEAIAASKVPTDAG